MIPQFFAFDLEGRKVVVKEGDTLSLGSHTLQFVMAPMVHWPEVMVAYETSEKILFSADGFGKFGALDAVSYTHLDVYKRQRRNDCRRRYSLWSRESWSRTKRYLDKDYSSFDRRRNDGLQRSKSQSPLRRTEAKSSDSRNHGNGTRMYRIRRCV